MVAAAPRRRLTAGPRREDFPRGGGGGPIFGMELCRHSGNAGNRGARPLAGSRPAETLGGRFRHPSRRTALTSDLRGEGDSGQIS